jgi:hypothetical protein
MEMTGFNGLVQQFALKYKHVVFRFRRSRNKPRSNERQNFSINYTIQAAPCSSDLLIPVNRLNRGLC